MTRIRLAGNETGTFFLVSIDWWPPGSTLLRVAGLAKQRERQALPLRATVGEAKAPSKMRSRSVLHDEDSHGRMRATTRVHSSPLFLAQPKLAS